MATLFQRDAITRARFFLDLARRCSPTERDEFEAFVEAAIVFARASLHRLKTRYEKQPGWKEWWEDLLHDEAVLFFRTERDHVLKEGPPKVGQVVPLRKQADSAAGFYYFESPDVPATLTVDRHLGRIQQLLDEATQRFG